MVVIRPAAVSEFPFVTGLLRAAKLPLEGLEENFSHVLVASDEGGTIVGSVALELYGDVALLRSLAVVPERRGEGLGERLAKEALALARAQGARDVYLLTETATRFFPRFGFGPADRSAAPESLGRSAEFQTACPASAVLMHARLA